MDVSYIPIAKARGCTTHLDKNSFTPLTYTRITFFVHRFNNAELLQFYSDAARFLTEQYP